MDNTELLSLSIIIVVTYEVWNLLFDNVLSLHKNLSIEKVYSNKFHDSVCILLVLLEGIL